MWTRFYYPNIRDQLLAKVIEGIEVHRDRVSSLAGQVTSRETVQYDDDVECGDGEQIHSILSNPLGDRPRRTETGSTSLLVDTDLRGRSVSDHNLQTKHREGKEQ